MRELCETRDSNEKVTPKLVSFHIFALSLYLLSHDPYFISLDRFQQDSFTMKGTEKEEDSFIMKGTEKEEIRTIIGMCCLHFNQI
jgi:hypothetical protein